MTKKDYIAIAKVLRERSPFRDAGTIALIAADLAQNVFAPDNPNFDRDRFLAACGFA